MPKRMLIDASHPEETRVVVLDGHKVEEFDFEAASKRPLKGNIYLAKVTRVEPSLQAAFVEYGGNRQGFLAFSEIHPDYYQIPVADRIAILADQTQRMMADEDFDAVEPSKSQTRESHSSSLSGESDAGDSSDEATENAESSEHDSSEHEGAPHDHAENGFGEDTESESQAETEDSFASSDSAENTESTSETQASEAQAGDNASAVVQTEATGAPVPHQRRDERRGERPRPRRRQYKIQEVIKRRQVMLIQVVKEERGNKGASLTTFLSLAGRYCVLMPNTPRGGGISRKITNAVDRKRLKSAAQSLELPEGMGLIIRTAGANRTKAEIKRDYEYLIRLWDTVRELTLKSNAPALVYEEGSLIKRVIRDLYNKDISEILVDGDGGYRDAKDFMRMLMPSHAKNVKPYKDTLPLFQHYHVEAQLDAMFSPVVTLRSGGYIVINQTEALVSIDVNSGKATREHSIEETAHKTNLEAADEIARQLRLRDLAGLIVIDFIDMEDGRNDRNVEKRLYSAVKNDRARIQIGKISQFGLLEMSRQRLRAGVLAGSTVTCPHCAGIGLIRSTESAALRLLRALDEEGQKSPAANVMVKAPTDVTIYTLNQKRREIARIEEAYDLAISFEPQSNIMGGSFEIERTGVRVPSARPKTAAISVDAGFEAAEIEVPSQETLSEEITADEGGIAPVPDQSGGQPNGQGDGKRKRRRRRRGGRGRGAQGQHHDGQPQNEPHHDGQSHEGHHHESTTFAANESGSASDSGFAGETAAHEDDGDASHEGTIDIAGSEESHDTQQSPSAEGGERHRRRRRRGRRGRRRDGEGNPSAAGEFSSPNDGLGEIASSDPEPFHQPAITPNEPSAPQWSLAELPSERSNELVPPVYETAKTETGGLQPDQSAPPESKVSDAANTLSENPEAGNDRKGWWQRRFKI